MVQKLPQNDFLIPEWQLACCLNKPTLGGEAARGGGHKNSIKTDYTTTTKQQNHSQIRRMSLSEEDGQYVTFLHWGQDEMDAILQLILGIIFFMKIVVLWFNLT